MDKSKIYQIREKYQFEIIEATDGEKTEENYQFDFQLEEVSIKEDPVINVKVENEVTDPEKISKLRPNRRSKRLAENEQPEPEKQKKKKPTEAGEAQGDLFTK